MLGGRVNHWGYGRRPCVAVSPIVGKKRACGMLRATEGGTYTVPVVAETAEGDGTMSVTYGVMA